MTGVLTLRQARTLTSKFISGLTWDELIEIPEGHGNNILWNLGHIVVVQQLLHYKLSGLPMYVAGELCDRLRTGTSPMDWSEPPDAVLLRSLLEELPEKLEQDYNAGRFTGFREYTTSTGAVLRNLEEAVGFNNFHEGVHLGVMMSILKQVRRP